MKPTVGRIVHYYYCEVIYAALIVYVHPTVDDKDLINLVFWDADGNQHTRIGLTDTPGGFGHWGWPPRV